MQTWVLSMHCVGWTHMTSNYNTTLLQLLQFIMVAVCNRADHYIFILWFLLYSFSSLPNLSRQRLDVYHTSTRGVALVQI